MEMRLTKVQLLCLDGFPSSYICDIFKLIFCKYSILLCFYPIVVVLSDLYIYLVLFRTPQPQVRKFLQRRGHHQNDIKLFIIIEIKTPTHLLFCRYVDLHTIYYGWFIAESRYPKMYGHR